MLIERDRYSILDRSVKRCGLFTYSLLLQARISQQATAYKRTGEAYSIPHKRLSALAQPPLQYTMHTRETIAFIFCSYDIASRKDHECWKCQDASFDAGPKCICLGTVVVVGCRWSGKREGPCGRLVARACAPPLIALCPRDPCSHAQFHAQVRRIESIVHGDFSNLSFRNQDVPSSSHIYSTRCFMTRCCYRPTTH